MKDIVHREVDLPCSTREAWEHVLDPSWLGGEGELPREPGAEGWVNDGGVLHYLIVEEVDDAERYVYRWASFTEPPSRVEIDLTPTDEGTRISIAESPIDVRARASFVRQ